MLKRLVCSFSFFRSVRYTSVDVRWYRPSTLSRRYVRSLAIPAGAYVGIDEVLGEWRRHKDSPDSLARCLYHSLKAANAQQLSPLQLVDIPEFQSFWQHLRKEIPYMSANSAVMCLYNCAQYNFKVDTAVSAALVDLCLQKFACIPLKAFGILLWSLYKLNLYQQNPRLVKEVVHHFHSIVISGRYFKPQAFANVLWVLASTHTWPESITKDVMKYVPPRVKHFDFHSLSIVLWAVTTAGLPLCNDLLKAAGDRAGCLLQKQLPVISTVHCCWAFGSASYYHEPFFSALKDRICTEPPESTHLTPRLLSSVAWACARTGYYHAGLLDHIAKVALTKLHHFNSHDLGNLAYSYGYLNHSSDRLLLTISQIMSSKPDMMVNELACASVASSCLIHGIYPEKLLSQLMSNKRVDAILKKGNSKQLHLYAQIHSLVKVERPDLQHCILQPPYDCIITVLALAESMVHCKRVFSVFHRNICKALLQITGSSQHFTKEALTTYSSFIDAEVILNREGKALPIPSRWRGWNNPRALLSVAYENPMLWKVINAVCCKQVLDTHLGEEVCVASDWEVRLGTQGDIARRVAIEADGPWHYAANCRHKLGNTLLKHRLLKAHGWHVIAIPHFEWQNLATDQDQINYLAQRLYSVHA